MEEDGDLEVIPVPVATGHLLALLDLRVDPLADGVGDPVLAVGQDVV